ncbi:kinase-like domain-containing protein [Clohesyomyces aquaticus]|uniref:non-specific serine/threonine protein kinase n=1 Tax=Clohesyomyces aquaticus TaxID=1231657 RepID=A0A1Y1ZXK9_9PLEO|nr:kinase-like domain-containing protein [Clohesyomyces aquaticus]
MTPFQTMSHAMTSSSLTCNLNLCASCPAQSPSPVPAQRSPTHTRNLSQASPPAAATATATTTTTTTDPSSPGPRTLAPAANLDASVAANARPRLVARASESSPVQPRRSLLSSKSSSAVPTLSTTHRFLPTYWLPANMTAASGANPTAADLLRQAMMQRSSEDDAHSDQIGSNSSTPPGAATPRPDPTDKRLPGILHSYFGQATPPQTPRTRSHEGKPPTSNLSHTSLASAVTTKAAKEIKKESTKAPAVGPPKGKLSVSISEGRGLRPSVDPYVVCQFQWAEYISEGPRTDASPKKTKDGASRGTGGLAIRRTDSDMGRPMAIPMKSRQSSNSGTSSDPRENLREVVNPKWEHDTIFDVVGDHSEIDISVYDRSNQEAFLGHVRFCPNLVEYEQPYDGWFTLEPRDGEEDYVTGEIHLKINFHKIDKKHYGPEDFEILKLIGKGTFGQVFQVRKRDTRRIYAMKVLSKKVIVQKKEVAHTLGERNILVRTAMAESPFIVGLKFSFQTPTDLYLVTDYMSGGELFWHLQREGRFHEARAKFYIAELILALQHLHEHNIVYRDLKPENILLDAKGHIALCDFGLSKANLTENATTNTFCGTTEYLAPEVLLDEHGYTKMVDFWSLGVLVFEMCCGWSPFYAEDTQQMYKNIAFGKVRFPRDALSTEGRNFVKGLLNRNPKHRLGATRDAEELKAHPFFADIDWDALTKKNVVPPFKPKLKSELDVSNFDPEFTNALNGNGSLNARAAALASGVNPASTPLSPTMQAKFAGFTFVDESTIEQQFRNRDQDLERMDEDDKEQDVDWEKPAGRGDRMSGIIPSNDHDIFGHGNFDA